MPPRTGKRKISYAESEEDSGGQSDLDEVAASSEDESLSASDDSTQKKTPKKETKAKSKPRSKSPGQAPKNAKSESKKSPAKKEAVAVISNAGAVIDITQGPPVTTDTAAKKLILQYMKQQNRPYSALQIHDNLHKRIPKPTVERVLISLSSPGEGLQCKEYGKTKIFFVDQSTLTTDFTEDQLEQLKSENDDLKEQVEALVLQEKEQKLMLARLTTEPADDDLDRVLATLESRLVEKKAKVAALTSGAGANADPKALQKAIKAHNGYRKAWFERRSLCMDAVDLLCDGLGKKRSELVNDLCIETDQDMGLALPVAIKEPR